MLLIIATIITSVSGDILDLICPPTNPIAQFYQVTPSQKSEITDGSAFNPALPTYFIIHGALEDASVPIYVNIAQTIANYEPTNVILVDYNKMAHEFYFTCAGKIVETVGSYVGKFIVKAYQDGNVDLTKVTLVAQSLGGQVAGHVGRTVYATLGIRIGRITGLDPAGPMFAFPLALLPEFTLGKEDALLVDVLHTTVFMGSIQPMGTIDFYVTNPTGWVIIQHSLGAFVYLESINSCGFRATKWSDDDTGGDEVVVGYHMKKDLSGIYTFTTNQVSPYAQGNPKCP